MRGAAEVVEDFAPSGVFVGTAAMTFVDDDEIEEVGRELPVDLLPFFLAGDCLIKAKIDLVVLLRPRGW